MGSVDDGVMDAYRPPNADEDEDEASEGYEPRFFVVSIPKLVLLDVLTLRIYSIYWFYKHWSIYKRSTGADVSPRARAIFSIFFVHRLFRAMDAAARDVGGAPAWSAQAQATVFVVLSLAGVLVGRIGLGIALSAILTSCLAMSTVLPLVAAQKVANYASRDPEGSSGARFGPEAILAAVLGLAGWSFYVYSLRMLIDMVGRLQQ